MQFVSNPTELTTAITDGCLAILSLVCAVDLFGLHKLNSWKVLLWCSALTLLAVGSVLGAVVHGLELTQSVDNLLWLPLYLSLGLAVALFAVSAIYDRWGASISRKALPFLLLFGCVCSIVIQVIAGDFLIFLVYEGVVVIFAMVIYTWLFVSTKGSGFFLIACGILLTILAAITQTIHTIFFTFIWQFNNNGLFHFIQMIAILLLAAGVKRTLRTTSVKTSFSARQSEV